jgi:hypothetical protein
MTRNARRRSRLGWRTRADEFTEARWFRGLWLGRCGPPLGSPPPSRWRTNRTECAIGRVPSPRVHDDAAHTPPQRLPQRLCAGRPRGPPQQQSEECTKYYKSRRFCILDTIPCKSLAIPNKTAVDPPRAQLIRFASPRSPRVTKDREWRSSSPPRSRHRRSYRGPSGHERSKSSREKSTRMVPSSSTSRRSSRLARPPKCSPNR